MTKIIHSYDNDAPSLCEAFANRFKVGAAINTWMLADEKSPEMQTILRQFNIFSLENESKPMYIHPAEDTYYFERFDRFADFGQKYKKTLRGHTLIWHSQCADWFFKDENGADASEDLLISRVREHVKTIVSRYRGRIKTWDVVNEVLRDEGGMRESKWFKLSGERYIDEAFIAAREADPDARLIINDYNLESSDTKADTMYELVKSMLHRGVPVDGVGLQMHLSIFTDFTKLRDNVMKLAELKKFKPDFKLEVTELDLSCYSWDDASEDIDITPNFNARFSAVYAKLFRLLSELSENGVLDSVVFWGINDGMSWLNGFPRKHKNYPLLIGRDYVLKEAFFDIIELHDTLDSRVVENGDDKTTREVFEYYSKTCKRMRRANIILPENFNCSKTYPVLYILHGYWGNENSMLEDGLGLQKLIGEAFSSGEAKEAVVVFPYLYASATRDVLDGFNEESNAAYDNFINDLVCDLMPAIAEKYPVKTGAENTAISGFSMGGRESLYIGLKRPDLFVYVGAMCPAPGVTELIKASEMRYDSKAPYILITAGDCDGVVGENPRMYHQILRSNSVVHKWQCVSGGEHSGSSIRPHIYRFIREIFNRSEQQ